MYKLTCAVQNYAWGKCGKNSEVADLANASDPSFQIETQTPYAELWMGTHSKGPSFLANSKQSLAEFISQHPETMGKDLSIIAVSDGKAQMPFLFKVLSVNKALSIQSHPNKEQAATLHLQNPNNYPDPNHKPEMAIALTPFEMLCGFRPAKKIAENINETPELFELIGSGPFNNLIAAIEANDPDAMKVGLQSCFSELVHQPEPLMQKNLSSLVERIALSVKTGRDGFNDKTHPKYVLGELILRLNYNFPSDVGCWMPFFLNHFVMQPGEASFLAPNEPHAYLYGDCIECMACSDNTIRAGLTPKYKDVETLVQNLTYRMGTVEENMLKPVSLSQYIMLYKTPVPEFDVEKIEVPESTSYTLPALPTCSIMIVLGGTAERIGDFNEHEVKTLTRGSIIYHSADTPISINVSSPFCAYRAFASADMLKDLVL